MITDKEIIQDVLSGEYEQYSLLIRKYNREVIKVVSAMLFAHQEMEDLVQKVFIDAYDKLDRFDLSRDFGKWVKGIARNTVRMHLRSKKTSDKHIKIYQDWAAAQHEADEDFEVLDSKSRALESCYEKVSESNRKIMDLKYRKSLSIQAIADRLGRSLEGITKALSRTRAELRTCIRRSMMDHE